MLTEAKASYCTIKHEAQIFKALQWPVNTEKIVSVDEAPRQRCVRLLECVFVCVCAIVNGFEWGDVRLHGWVCLCARD